MSTQPITTLIPTSACDKMRDYVQNSHQETERVYGSVERYLELIDREHDFLADILPARRAITKIETQLRGAMMIMTPWIRQPLDSGTIRGRMPCSTMTLASRSG